LLKKNGVDIKQIAANLRWKNKIKQSSLDDRKIEKFLDGMDKMCNKYGIPVSDAAEKLFSIIETMLRRNIEPHRLKEEIDSMISELQRLKTQIEASNNLLEETKARVEKEQKTLRVKEKELDQFHQISNLLEMYEYSEISEEYGNVASSND
jgi:predicted patatin/cPLA2 family phospholipase